MATNNHSGTTIVQQHALTPNDYLTVTPDGIFLDGQPATEYYGTSVKMEFCIAEDMIKRLVKRFPIVTEIHCMVSYTMPPYIEYDYCSESEKRKYNVLRYNLDEPMKRGGFNKWSRIHLVDGTNTPWHCIHDGIKKSKESQELSDQISQDLFGDAMFGRLLDIQICIYTLVPDILAYILVNENMIDMLKYLSVDPELIAQKMVEGRELIRQKQSELLQPVSPLRSIFSRKR